MRPCGTSFLDNSVVTTPIIPHMSHHSPDKWCFSVTNLGHLSGPLENYWRTTWLLWGPPGSWFHARRWSSLKDAPRQLEGDLVGIPLPTMGEFPVVAHEDANRWAAWVLRWHPSKLSRVGYTAKGAFSVLQICESSSDVNVAILAQGILAKGSSPGSRAASSPLPVSTAAWLPLLWRDCQRDLAKSA